MAAHQTYRCAATYSVGGGVSTAVHLIELDAVSEDAHVQHAAFTEDRRQMRREHLCTNRSCKQAVNGQRNLNRSIGYRPKGLWAETALRFAVMVWSRRMKALLCSTAVRSGVSRSIPYAVVGCRHL